MTFPYKAVFVDLDGTLFAPEGKLTQVTKETLLKLHKAGIPVVVTTGRPMDLVESHFKDFPHLGPVSTLNGAVVYEGFGKEPHVFTKGLEHSLVPELLNAPKTQELSTCILSETVDIQYTFPFCTVPEEFGDAHPKTTKVIASPEDLPHEPCLSILIHNEDESKRVQLTEEFRKLYGNSANVINYHNWPWMEVSPTDVCKGYSMEYICKNYLGISHTDVIAFGDNSNDLEMLKEAGMGVAMENASDAVKAVSNEQTVSCQENGVAVYLNKLL